MRKKMCEAEDRLRKVYKWLRKNHMKVYMELDELEVEELRKEALG